MHQVIYNTTQRKYVTPPGRKSSYTKDPFKARRYPTKEAAEADCCGDEHAVTLIRYIWPFE